MLSLSHFHKLEPHRYKATESNMTGSGVRKMMISTHSDRDLNETPRVPGRGALLSRCEVRKGFQADSPFQLGLLEWVDFILWPRHVACEILVP